MLHEVPKIFSSCPNYLLCTPPSTTGSLIELKLYHDTGQQIFDATHLGTEGEVELEPWVIESDRRPEVQVSSG